MHLHQLLNLKNWILLGGKLLKNQFTYLQRRKVKDQIKIEIWDANLDRQPKIQSSSVEETLQRFMEQTNNDCRFLIDTLRKQCNGSKKWSWLIQWMNWDLRHLLVVFQCRTLKYLMRGLLQPWTKSSIIPTSKEESVWRNKRPRSRTGSFAVDRLPTWSTITSGSLGAMILSKNYADLFTFSLRNDDIQAFDSKWDGISLSMTKIPHDDILEFLDEKWTFWEERRGQESGNKTACIKNFWRLLAMGTNGQCVKGDTCSFRHDTNKRGKVTPSNPSPNSFMQQNERKSSRTRSPRGRSPSGRVSRWPCKDFFRGTCNNSFCEKWRPPECLFYKTKSGRRFGEKCSFAPSGWRTADEMVQIE